MNLTKACATAIALVYAVDALSRLATNAHELSRKENDGMNLSKVTLIVQHDLHLSACFQSAISAGKIKAGLKDQPKELYKVIRLGQT